MAQALERLVIVMRETPRADEVHAARADAGVEDSAIALNTTLRGRMLTRAVDWIEIEPQAPADALLSVARALASDDLPLPMASGVQVMLVPLPVPFDDTPVHI